MDAVHTMVAIMNDMEVRPADRLLAARMILDRAVGTPVAAVEVTSTLTVSLVELLAGLPGPKAAVIEHEAPPPPLVAGISLQEASEAAAELEGQAAAAGDDDGRPKGRAAEAFAALGETISKLGEVGAGRFEQQEEDGELILRPANDDLGGTQPGGE
jgi:hypothetical protein